MKNDYENSGDRLMIKIIMVIGGGGYFFQSMSLLKKINQNYQIKTIISNDSLILKSSIPENIGEPIETIIFPAIRTFSISAIEQPINFIKCFLQACFVFYQEKPQAVLVIANSLAVPLFLAAKLFNIKTVYIDSITRVGKPSKTGLIISKLKLANKFYVQWKEAENLYPNAIYKGTVL